MIVVAVVGGILLGFGILAFLAWAGLIGIVALAVAEPIMIFLIAGAFVAAPALAFAGVQTLRAFYAGATWAWGVIAAGSAALLVAGIVEATQGRGLSLFRILGVMTLLAALAAPSTRAWFGPPLSRGALHRHGRMPTLGPVSWWLAGIITLFLAAAFALHPSSSLMSSENGSSLRPDAWLGVLGGLALVGAGSFAARRTVGFAAAALWGSSAGVALVVAFLLVASADGAARAPLVGASATGGRVARDTLLGLMLLLTVVHSLLMLITRDRRASTWAWVAGVMLAFGAATALSSGWLLVEADTLRAAAEARQRRVPGAGVVASLAAFALALALFQRSSRRR